MHELIAWSGFLGAWLLVAGPIYQAIIELQEEGFERDDFDLSTALAEAPRRPSRWWWLLPPVGYVLQRRWSRAYQRAVMSTLPADRMRQLIALGDKATGWIFVAAGAFFIAVKETWELGEVYEWPHLVFWLLVVVMLAAAAANTVIRTRRTRRLMDTFDPATDASPAPTKT